MKKAANADIRNLFRKFGGDTGNYQEIQQEYVVDKAQKSWPIVTAMEKERASAPVLRTSVENPVARVSGLPGANTGSFAALKPGVSVTPRAPVVRQAEGARAATGLFARQAEPVAPRSLFGALNSVEKPAAPRTLFSPAPAQVNTGAPVRAQPVQSQFQPKTQSQPSEKDQIASLFSRLVNPQGVVATPDKSLRSLFGFLKK